MYNEEEQHSTTGDIRPDEVQILIDQRMAYLIEKEREEADMIKSESNASNRMSFRNNGFSRIKNLFGGTHNKDDKESALLNNIQNKNTGYE